MNRQAHPFGKSAGASARVVLVALFKDKWKLAAAFAATFGVALGLSFLITPKFVASALLYVKYGREYTYRVETGTSEVVPQAFDRSQIIRSEAQILAAPAIADAVIAKLGIARLYPKLAATEGKDFPAEAYARQAFLSSLDAVGGDESNIIELTFRHPDPVVAADALNALIEAYMAKRRPLFAEIRALALEDETGAAKKQLDTTGEALERFRLANDIVAFDAQRQMLLDRRSSLARDLQLAESELAADREREAKLKAQLGSLAPTIVLEAENQPNPAMAEAQKTLLDLQLRAEDLKGDWNEQSRPVQQVRRSIDQVEQTLRMLAARPNQLVRTGLNPVHEALATQLATVEAQVSAEDARRKTVAGQLDKVAAELAALAAKERTLDALGRERDLAAANYTNLARELDDARLLDKLAQNDSANVRVLQPAQPPVEAQNPQPLILMVGLVAAVLAALMTAFVSDLLRSGYLTPEQLEWSTGLPVLATIPMRRRKVAS
ncbi:MAG: hypothetical protein KDG89_11085 [Geminicoccaceae bacterium]|nr:hypothetical protein [Geminicoccaceae bacterium]